MVDPHINLVVSVASFEIMTGKGLEIRRVCSQSGYKLADATPFSRVDKLQVIQTDLFYSLVGSDLNFERLT